MSRKKSPPPVAASAEPFPLPAAQDARPPAATDSSQPATDQAVPKCRQCPVCWGGMGGVGVVYCTQGNRNFFGCDKCGFTWVISHGPPVTKRATANVPNLTRPDGRPFL